MKQKGRGKAALFQDGDFQKLIDATVGENHKLIFQLAYWTAARIGEVRQLPVISVYNSDGVVKPEITFWSEISKNQENRKVPVSTTLKSVLENYWTLTNPVNNFYLFPGMDKMEPIQFQSIDDAFRRAIAKAGLEDKGYSCHSMRSTAISKMDSAGIAPGVIMQISGHKYLSCLQPYLQLDGEKIMGAIATL